MGCFSCRICYSGCCSYRRARLSTLIVHESKIGEQEPGRCEKGHILETYAMPKEGRQCSGCGRSGFREGTLSRGCRRCNYDVCEQMSTQRATCERSCMFGPPISGTSIHLQGPMLRSEFCAENVLVDKIQSDPELHDSCSSDITLSTKSANIEFSVFQQRSTRAWIGPEGKSSWFILDLGSPREVGGFEMRNAMYPSRLSDKCADEFVIEASLDDRSYRVVSKGKLPKTEALVQVGCIESSVVRYIKFSYRSLSGGGLLYFAALRPAGQPPPRYLTPIPPPKHLWDVSSPQHLEMVRCQATIIVSELSPKFGTFSLRMKCSWSFRTLKESQGSEIQLRGVPGIRMPALSVTVEESRLWKDLNGDRPTDKSIYWEGTSTFTISGFKNFNMEHFPFDRHVIDLEQLIFVWRPDKDAADHYKPMKVVSFTIDTVSTLSEWHSRPAYVIPIAKYVTTPESNDDPSYATQFIVKLRVEHQHLFYVWQVLFPALLMTLTSVAPLAMPPMEDDMGDRLSVYGGGLLTLVAFKYGVADHLPSVPYATYVDTYLKWQLICISFCALESVVSFHLILQGYDHEHDDIYWNLDKFENLMFYILMAGWSIYFALLGFIMPLYKLDWRDVWDRSAKTTPYFERAQVDNDRRPHCFPMGAKFIVLRDDLPVWDVIHGQRIDELAVRTVVQATGELFSTAAQGRRIHSKDDELYTQEEFRKKYPADWEIHWDSECKDAIMMPLQRGAVVVHRASPEKMGKSSKGNKHPSELPYDIWQNVRLLEKDVVVDHKKPSRCASDRFVPRCCPCEEKCEI